MPGRRVWRFVLEVVFLVGVASALTAAHERAALVAAVMGLAWVVVALFEWASWFDVPHFGRGLPPRYYVPEVALPPPHPVERTEAAYPEVDEQEDDLTWIVPPAAWGEVLEDWPAVEPLSAGEATEIAVPEAGAGEPEYEAAVPELEHTSELGVSSLDEPPVPAEVEPAEVDSAEVVPAEVVPAEVVPAEVEPAEVEPAEAEAPPMPAAEAAPIAEPTAPPADATREQAPDPREHVVRSEAGTEGPGASGAFEGRLIARHGIDPLAESQGGRFRRRRPRDDGAVVEVPDRPPPIRSLPGRAGRQE